MLCRYFATSVAIIAVVTNGMSARTTTAPCAGVSDTAWIPARQAVHAAFVLLVENGK